MPRVKLTATPKLTYVPEPMQRLDSGDEEIECNISWRPSEEHLMTPTEKNLVDAITALTSFRVRTAA
jgi:hypothetical protein